MPQNRFKRDNLLRGRSQPLLYQRIRTGFRRQAPLDTAPVSDSLYEQLLKSVFTNHLRTRNSLTIFVQGLFGVVLSLPVIGTLWEWITGSPVSVLRTGIVETSGFMAMTIIGVALTLACIRNLASYSNLPLH